MHNVGHRQERTIRYSAAVSRRDSAANLRRAGNRVERQTPRMLR